MSPNALAIDFAPCILRTDKPQYDKDSLDDVASQVTAVRVLIEETITAASKPAADEIPVVGQLLRLRWIPTARICLEIMWKKRITLLQTTT